MLKKVPIMPVWLQQKSLLLEMVSGSFGTDYSGNYASILDASLDQRREDMTSFRSDSWSTFLHFLTELVSSLTINWYLS